MDTVIIHIRQELESLADTQFQETSRRFFKESIVCYGIKTPVVTALAKKYWKEIKSREKQEIFSLCEELYRSGQLEESFIVSTWTYLLSGRYERKDIDIFRRWIDTYITNWASCDGFCNHALGDFIEIFPECIANLKQWTRSGNRWMRRAAAVSLIIPSKHGKFLHEALEIADLLLLDNEDMVQKGYGWLLKEASRHHQADVFEYVIRNRQVMPRTALRYAIELMPPELKNEAMKKELPGEK